jgi:hypothetical protein
MLLKMGDGQRDKATCPDKVVPRNNNKAKSSTAKGTIAP